MINNIMEQLNLWIKNTLSLSEKISFNISITCIILATILMCIIINFITKKIILAIISKIVKKSKTIWDDILLENRFFDRFSHIVPILFILYVSESAFTKLPTLYTITTKFCYIYFAIVFLMCINIFLKTVNQIYNLTIGKKKQTSIKSYIQVAQIFFYLVAILIVLSILLNKEIAYFLGGLGAMTAVLMLVFRDSIMGFVAGIQLTANDMVRIGDWISIPSRNADGSVIEVTLNTVKIQNWDNTIATIPTYALVSESFNNWRGMEESGGRRIKRSIKIDIKSIKFCSEELLERLTKFHLLKGYLNEKTLEINEYNKEINLQPNDVYNGRRITNVGAFRKYLELYLRSNKDINQSLTLLVRQLDPSEIGLPIEIYVFTAKTGWIDYEGIQADIFDHIFAIIHDFELRVFQSPSGDDLQNLTKLESAQNIKD